MQEREDGQEFMWGETGRRVRNFSWRVRGGERSLPRRDGCGWRVAIPLAILATLIISSAALGGGCAVRGGDYRAVLGGSFGNKDLTRGTIPWYTAGLIGRNDSIINSTVQLNIGPFELVQTLGIGRYIISPDVALDLNLSTK